MYKHFAVVFFIPCWLCASGHDKEDAKQSMPSLGVPSQVSMAAIKTLAERARAMNNGEPLTVIAAADMYGENNLRNSSVIKLDYTRPRQEESSSRHHCE